MSYVCEECDRGFNTERAIEQHFQNSSNHGYYHPEFECDYCDDIFSSRFSRTLHTEESHFFKCDFCNVLSTSQHAQRFHTLETHHFECDFCYDVLRSEHARELHERETHHYCEPCNRTFMNGNCYKQHMHSSVHVGKSAVTCPWCKEGFATASGLIVHLESGRCTVSRLDRKKLNDAIQRLDRNHVITKPLLNLPGFPTDVTATESAWNGHCYKCYLCHRGFKALVALNQHLRSPAHEMNIYQCPGRTCEREYKVLSGLIQHIESESCGFMKFAHLQKQARGGVQKMVGRMIGG